MIELKLSCSVKFLRSIFDFLLYSNLFIAIGAVALVLSNQLTVGDEMVFDNTCWFVLFSTVFAYSLLKYSREDDKVDYTIHQSWAKRYPQVFRNLMLISLVASGAFFLKMNTEAKITIVVLAVFTAFYGYLQVPFPGKKRRLREIGLLKTLFVGLVWSFTTVLVPFSGQHLATDTMVFLLLRRFLFILALTIPFEIKDLWIDRPAGIITLPMRIGVERTKLLAQGVLLLLIGINIFQYFFFYVPLADMVAFNLSLMVSILAIQPIKESTGDKWFYFVLDGMMLVQFLFVYAAHKWFMA